MTFDPRLPDERVNVSEGSVVREAALLVAGVVGVAVLATLAIAFGIEWIVPRVPVALEAKLFGGIATAIAERQDSPLDERAEPLQALLDRLAARWPDAPYPFRSGVLDDDLPNAFALPGGAILVTTGLLDRLSNENELAFVLSHELGHFHGRDHLRGIGRGVAIGCLSLALGLGDDAAAFLANTASSLSTRHFDRNQESDADLFGLGLLVGEYGHGGGATDVFERVLRDEDEQRTGSEQSNGSLARAADRVSGYLSTHPLGPRRIEALHAHARQQGWSLQGGMSPWPPPGR